MHHQLTLQLRHYFPTHTRLKIKEKRTDHTREEQELSLPICSTAIGQDIPLFRITTRYLLYRHIYILNLHTDNEAMKHDDGWSNTIVLHST